MLFCTLRAKCKLGKLVWDIKRANANLTANSWPYKFVHEMLQILLDTGNLNLQANTPAMNVSEKDKDGWITVTTPRGDVRTKAVIHATVCLRERESKRIG